ncbi:TPA: BppU family phage baseplate upper protein [Enterococcus faecium]|nr:BppU family phage baseplate upper protein [Enterococcus faecium]HAQ2371821.1 BppU family phage baseplate upper protein [Enterococcus faecium]HAQ2658601.1 BppU family phage baseplate upper protein [Enterococcus faecium]HAQ2664960.1 BppU family phage baseplate upper protein [Enterococcus faecium]HAQ2684010.1 BppU family phage baseplate upper protein [Enterococcus faecium]
MAHVIKKGSITVPTQPKDYDLQATGLVFKSYDNQIALEFNVEQQNGTPADLLGANLRLLMFIYDEVDGMITKEPIPFITKNLITESFLNGQVVYILPEAMKAYNGMVEAYVYIEYPDGSTSDNLGFTFRMKRSAIDGLAQDKADYFIADFQQLLDGVKQEATDAVNEVLAKVEAVSKNVSSAQNDLTILEDRIDQTNQQIGDLGKLKKMYSNSLEFGGYDYSGKPNLMTNKLVAGDFYMGYHGSLTNVNGMLHFMSDGTGDIDMFTRINTPQLASGKTYTLSAKVRFDEGTTGAINKLRLVYRTSPGENILLEANNTTITIDDVGKEITIKGTANVNYQITNLDRFYISVSFSNRDKINGGFKLYDIKIEEGSTATPYQPNLLDDPYWVGKTSLGKNIANKGTTFPIKSSAYEIYKGNTEEELIIGQTYTITLKGTKPASQTFVAYNYWNVNFGDLKPVEGLTDVWSLTFTPTKLEPGLPKDLRIFQSPKETAGACRIDWLKIEKGDTRTPNISEYKYFGEGLKDSNDPNDYSWDITPEYAEKSLNNTVSLTEPQTVLGLKNFSDGIQISGDHVVGENEHTIYKLDKSNSNSFIDGYATFIKHGKIVIVNGTVKFKKAYAFGVPLDDEVPEEFIARGVNGMIIGVSGTSNSAKMIYVRQDFKSIMTNSEFAINEWFTFNGVYWVGEE